MLSMGSIYFVSDWYLYVPALCIVCTVCHQRHTAFASGLIYTHLRVLNPGFNDNTSPSTAHGLELFSI